MAILFTVCPDLHPLPCGANIRALLPVPEVVHLWFPGDDHFKRIPVDTVEGLAVKDAFLSAEGLCSRFAD